MLQAIIREITPPYLLKILKKIRLFIIHSDTQVDDDKLIDDDKLFNGDNLLFKSLAKKASIYGEYGCGHSTIWISNNTQIKIISVDSSKIWIEKIKGIVKEQQEIMFQWIDCGELEEWGRPKTYEKRENFQNYINAIWQYPSFKPDLILIDGRFRVACLLASLLNSNPGTKIIFDDYFDRPHYHVVEEFIQPIDKCGRQALFIVPSAELDTLLIEKIKLEILNFRYVLD